MVLAANFFSPTNLDFILLLLGGYIIDLDHVLYHLFTEKNLSPSKFKKIHVNLRLHHIPKFYVFHTFESFVLVLIATIVFPRIIYFTVGYLNHLFFDFVYYIMYYKNLKWIKHWTVTYYFRKNLKPSV